MSKERAATLDGEIARDVIRLYMEEHPLVSQAEVARRLGADPSALSRFLRVNKVHPKAEWEYHIKKLGEDIDYWGYDSCGKRRGVSHIEIVVKDATNGSTDAPDEKSACEDANSAAPSTCGEAPDGQPDEHGAAEQETPRSKSKRSVKSKDAKEDNNGQ